MESTVPVLESQLSIDSFLQRDAVSIVLCAGQDKLTLTEDTGIKVHRPHPVTGHLLFQLVAADLNLRQRFRIDQRAEGAKDAIKGAAHLGSIVITEGKLYGIREAVCLSPYALKLLHNRIQRIRISYQQSHNEFFSCIELYISHRAPFGVSCISSSPELQFQLLLYLYSVIITSMSQSDLFVAKLDEALMGRASTMTKDEIPKLKDYCRTFQSSYMGLYKVFLEKGLIQEDQYDYEQKISDLKAPPSDPFSESDTFNQMNIRMQEYANQLDFLNSFFFMSPETLSLKGIKNILALINYFHWNELSINSAHIMTRSLAAYLEKVKQTGDTMALNIIANSLKMLKEHNKSIKKILKGISVYSRQNYKLQCRMNVLNKMTLDPIRIQKDFSGTLQAIKFEFPVLWEGNPFYRELVEETLNEDYSSEGDALKEKILKELEVTKKVVRKKKIDKSAEMKKELLILVAELAKVYIPMETIITRLDDNARVQDENVKGFTQKFSRWFSRVMLQKNEIYYEISTSSLGRGKKREKMNFTSYLNWLRTKSTYFKNLNNPTSTSYLRAAESDHPQLSDFLNKNQMELKKIINRLASLEQFFKEETDQDVRSRMKGYKAEIQQMKMVVTKVVTGLKEYEVQLEEIEQLQALGINPDS